MAEEASEFKIAVIGESGVGKSCIVSSFSNDDDGHATEGLFINILFFYLFFGRLYCFFTSGCNLMSTDIIYFIFICCHFDRRLALFCLVLFHPLSHPVLIGHKRQSSQFQRGFSDTNYKKKIFACSSCLLRTQVNHHGNKSS